MEAGETAGRLDVAIDNAVFIFEWSKKIRGAILSGLSYPALLVVIAIGFIAMFGIQIVPAFDEVLPREQWTGMGAQMAMMADFVHSRSEERRVGEEGGSTCRSRGSPYH